MVVVKQQSEQLVDRWEFMQVQLLRLDIDLVGAGDPIVVTYYQSHYLYIKLVTLMQLI